jgi:type I restriction enzyme R subunit
MKTDTSEKGLEALIVADLTGRKAPTGGGFSFVGLHNWLLGDPKSYDRVWTVDLAQLRAFIVATQPPLLSALDLDNDSPIRQKFLARLQGEIGRRGVIDVLRHGVKHGQHNIDLFYGTPSPGNPKAAELFALNRFSVTRQFRYSREDTANALDLGLFITGLPIATFELKNSLTKQTVEDAVEQYKRDRDPARSCLNSAGALYTSRSMKRR